MLSHYNLIADIEAIAQLFWINSSDRIVGVLPFFHSFGFTVTIWFPLLSGCGVVYHPNPTDARAIGELVQKHKATLLLTTPTFCSTYTRKCSAEEFASLRYVLVGAEKLPATLGGSPSTNAGGCASGSPEETFLRNDLIAHQGDCTLIHWHQPAWSEGDNGPTDTDYQAFWNDAVQYHVTAIVNGHDHDYERWKPLNASGVPSATGVTESSPAPEVGATAPTLIPTATS